MANYTPITINDLNEITNLQNTDKLLVSRGNDTSYTTGAISINALSSQMHTLVKDEFTRQQQELGGMIDSVWPTQPNDRRVVSEKLAVETKNAVARCLDCRTTNSQSVQGPVNFQTNPTTSGNSFSSTSLVTQSYVSNNFMSKQNEILVFSGIVNGAYNYMHKDVEIPLSFFITPVVNSSYNIYLNYMLVNKDTTVTTLKPTPSVGGFSMTRTYGQEYLNKDNALSKYFKTVTIQSSSETHKIKIFNTKIDLKYINASIAIFKVM